MPPIDQLIRSQRRTIALIIEPDGRLVVRAPRRARLEDIQRFIEQKEKWIRATQERLRSREPFTPKSFAEGECFRYLGELYPLILSASSHPALSFDGVVFRLGHTAQPRAAAVFERWYRRQALQLLSERLQVLGSPLGYSWQKLRITSARTRWASCSTRGTLSFSWRLIMAPLPVIDYVVIHELVHLKIHNHSTRFWSRVRELVPDYRERIDWLEKNGHLLRLE